MHRRFRCHFLLLMTLTVAVSTVSASDVHAQQAPSDIPTVDSKPNVTPKKNHTHKTHHTVAVATDSSADSAPQGRLDVRLKLGDGLHVWTPTRRQVGVTYADSGSDQSLGGQFKFLVDRIKLRSYLTKTAPYVRRSPKDAYPVVDGAGDGNAQQLSAKIVPEVDGAVLDVNAAVDAVQKAITSDPATLHIVLPVKTKPAEVKASDLQGINARIGYFVTHFNPGEVGRTMTVRRAISILDGHVLMPGAILSINEVVGERTLERGFGVGHVFVDGKMEKQVGGGMCQVATTLFNASMLANLKIVERHQHVRTVPYVAPGRDATVWYGQKDFKVENDTSAPIYLSYKTTATHAIVSLYGKAVPGRKVVLVSQHERLAARYYTGTFYRVVHRADGTVTKDPPFHSVYKWTPALDYSH